MACKETLPAEVNWVVQHRNMRDLYIITKKTLLEIQQTRKTCERQRYGSQ